ncbi:MAG: hypothetical protein LPJ89_04140 [Hymenobacteraceae bacterium]|nr:hypothetical protein [Hymenobacteraceae bacterium]MDX5395980.1 hypothetical protein [Hymenobacteraceae bacterium]MDX5442954.1 hypothetical protein [Hymenobacteraceae bacterium]MDX5512041.1 hypothetical protein [Hymenobacteraceae bacterium]
MYNRRNYRYDDYERYADDNRRNYMQNEQQGAYSRWEHHDDRFRPYDLGEYHGREQEWHAPQQYNPQQQFRGDHPAYHRQERPFWRFDKDYRSTDQHTSDRWPEDPYVRDRLASPYPERDNRYRRHERW